MKYPEEIIPKSNYKLLEDLGKIFDDCKVCLLRRVDDVGSGANEGKVKDILRKYISKTGRDKLNEFSVSMVGGGFKLEHMAHKVLFDEEIDDTWDGVEECDVESFKDRAKIASDFSVLCFIANDVHNVDFEAQNPSKLAQKFKIEAESNQPDLKALPVDRNNSFIKHKPTIFNYWHVQIHFKDSEGNDFPSKSSPTTKKFSPKQKEALQTFLEVVLLPQMKLATPDDKHCESIDPSHYTTD